MMSDQDSLATTYDRSTVQVFEKREHSGPDGKRLCSYGGTVCTQRPMKNYDFCVKHILQDPTAPFKQCDYLVSKNSNKLCANPVKITANEDTRYCNAHKQMLGLIPKGSGQYSKKKKQQMAAEKKASSTTAGNGASSAVTTKRSRKTMEERQLSTPTTMEFEENSETETEDEETKLNDTNQPKRSKKRKLMTRAHRKQAMTFHEDFFNAIDSDSDTDSDVQTDDESEQALDGPLDSYHFSSMMQNPVFTRLQAIQLQQTQQNTHPVPSVDHLEKHVITREEYLRMRRLRIERLLVIYQRQHAKLKKNLKEKYKNFILQKEQVLNSLATAADNNNNKKVNVRLKVVDPFQPPAKPIFEFPDDNAQIYFCEKVEKVDADGNKLCSFAQCNNKCMLANDFCFHHILYDNNQRLYKAGSNTTDPILCAAPSTKKETLPTESGGSSSGKQTVAVISREHDYPELRLQVPNNEEQKKLIEMIEQYRSLKTNEKTNEQQPQQPQQQPQQQTESLPLSSETPIQQQQQQQQQECVTIV